jgi:hypothetical protein
VAHHRRVDEEEQRLGDQGEEGGDGEPEDLPVLGTAGGAQPLPVLPGCYHGVRLGATKTCVKPEVSVGIQIVEGLCRQTNRTIPDGEPVNTREPEIFSPQARS